MSGIRKVESYAFFHKTVQEFFAALWLGTQCSEEVLNQHFRHIRNTQDVLDNCMLIQFLCGICPKAGTEFWLYIMEERIREKEKKYASWTFTCQDTENDQKLLPMLQDIALKCSKEACQCNDLKSDQIHYCLTDIEINSLTSDEHTGVLRNMMSIYPRNIKSLTVSGVVKCLSLLDLQSLHNLEILELRGLSVCGLFLPHQEHSRLRTLTLADLLLTHQDTKQLCSTLSSLNRLELLKLINLTCCDHSSSCLPELDLRKAPMLWKLILRELTVEGLLLPTVKESIISNLILEDLTMPHLGIEQLTRSLSICDGLERLELIRLSCGIHCGSCNLPALDLQTHRKLLRLELRQLSFESVLLPVKIQLVVEYCMFEVKMPPLSWRKFIEALTHYDIVMNVELVSCNIDNDIRDNVTSFRQFQHIQIYDDTVAFQKMI